MDTNDKLHITMSASDEGLTALLSGRLTAASVAASAQQVLEPIKRTKLHDLIIDGSEIAYCDGAGIGLIGEIRRIASIDGGVLQFRGFSQDLQALIDMSALPDPRAP